MDFHFSQKQVGSWAVVGLLFLLPLSSTGKSIFLALSIGSIVAVSSYHAALISLISKGWCKALIFFFAIVAVACINSPADVWERLLVLEKYSKILYLPILVLAFTSIKTRVYAIHAFLLAIALTCMLSILKFHGFLSWINISSDFVFRNHIMTGIMVAFATYISILLFFNHQLKQRLFYGLLVILFTYQALFVSCGRTGYIVYLLLMLLLIVQCCSWKQALAGIAIVLTLFSLSYFQSTVLKERTYLLVEDLHNYHKNEKNTNLGYRLQFHAFAYKLFNKHPLIGNGTGSFTYYFRTDKPVPSWDRRLLEPHSQYWLIAAEDGMLGIIALLVFLYTLSKVVMSIKTYTRQLALAILALFLVGNLSDSLLFYSGSGYFFIVFMALCLGEAYEEEFT